MVCLQPGTQGRTQLAKQHLPLLQENAPFKPDYAAVREDISRLLDDEDYDDGMPPNGSNGSAE